MEENHQLRCSVLIKYQINLNQFFENIWKKCEQAEEVMRGTPIIDKCYEPMDLRTYGHTEPRLLKSNARKQGQVGQ